MTAVFDPNTRTFLKALATGAAVAAAGCTAPPKTSFDEGFEYRVAAQPLPASGPPGRIEVVEFFWYGCPHCNAMEPLVESWRKRQPEDVVFRKLHVGGATPERLVHQRTFFALRALGRDEAINPVVFRAIHEERRALATRDEVADLLASAGIERAGFVRTFDSAAVSEAIERGDAQARAYGVTGVPSLGVQGRWLTSPGMAGTYADALVVVDWLVGNARKGGVKAG